MPENSLFRTFRHSVLAAAVLFGVFSTPLGYAAWSSFTAGDYAAPRVGGTANMRSAMWNKLIDNVDDLQTRLINLTFSSGNVGIGTPTPGAKLEVAGQVKITGGTPGVGKVLQSDATGLATWSASAPVYTEVDPQVGANTANYVPKWNGSALVTGILFDNGTNIGIGNAAPGYKLDVTGTSNFSQRLTAPYGSVNSTAGYSWTDAAINTTSIEIVNNAATVSTSSPTLAFHRYGTGGPQFRLDPTGTNVLYLESANAASARNPNAYGGGANTYFSRFHVDGQLSTSGNVGIGTPSPTAKLEVAGQVKITGGTPGVGKVLTSDAVGLASWSASAPLYSYTETDPQVGANTTNYVPKWNGTALVTGTLFDNGTNVGIGAATPNEKFDVNGAIQFRGTSVGYATTQSVGMVDFYNAGSRFLSFGANGTTRGIFSWYQAGQNNAINQEAMRIDTNGNLGIGTTAPGAKLDVTGNIRHTGRIINNAGVKTYAVSVGSQWNVNSTYELMRISRDSANWSSKMPYEITVYNTYYRGSVTKWIVNYNQVDAGSVVATESNGLLPLKLYLGSEVSASGTIYYRPVLIDLPNYQAMSVEIKYNTADVASITGDGQVQFTGTISVGTGTNYNGTVQLATSGGNVGIGTATPATKLDVQWGVRIGMSTDYSASLSIQNNGNGGMRIFGDANGLTNSHIYMANAANNKAASMMMNNADGRFSIFNYNGTWNERLTLTAGGDFGIGTATPGAKLEVAGQVKITGGTPGVGKVLTSDATGLASWSASAPVYTEVDPQVGANTTNYVPKWNGSALIAGTLFDNGTVGIWNASPLGKFHAGDAVTDYSTLSFANAGWVFSSIWADHNQARSNVVTLIRDGVSGVRYAGAARFDLSRWASDGVNARTQLDIALSDTDTATLTDVLSLRSNGNVGIGTASPTSKLHVEGVGPVARINAITDSSQQAQLKLSWSNSDTHGLTIGYKANSAQSYIDATYPAIAGQVYGDIYFRRNVLGTMTDTMAIKGETGNVGIGTTAPGAKLDISGVGAGTIDTTKGIRFGDGFSGIAPWNFNPGGSGNYRSLTFYTTGWDGVSVVTRNVMTIGNYDGNVGIGTTTPGNKLQVQGGALAVGTPGSYAFSAGNSNANDVTVGSDASASYVQSWNSKPLYLNHQGNNTVINQSPGRVLIGTTSDNGVDKLQVTGSANVSGNLTVQGSVITDKLVNRTVNNVSVSGSILPDAAAPLVYRDIGSSAQRWNNLYLSGQIVSGVATGTAPFTVASTTVNANLNADLLDGLDSTAFSQIGNTVESAEITDGTITSADIADGTIASADIGTDVIVAGNIAVGWVGSSEILNNSILNADINAAAAIAPSKIATDATNRFITDAERTAWNTTASATATGMLTGTDWSAFNAKAPTASPAFTGVPTAPTAAAADNTTQVATTAFVKSQGYLTSFSETDPQVGANTTNYLPKWNGSALVTGNVYDDGTSVGIGTATPGISKLMVNGGPILVHAGTNNAVAYRDVMMGGVGWWIAGESHGIETVYGTAAAPTTFTRIESSFDGTMANMYFKNFYNAGPQAATLMTIKANGNVGIGTTAPSKRLDVRADSDTLGLDVTNAAGKVWQRFTTGNQANEYGRFEVMASGVRYYGTQPYVNFSNVNVGIGTDTPGAKLEVAGQIKITGGTPGTGKVLKSDAVGLASWGQVVSADITDGTVTSADIANGTIAAADIATDTITAGNIAAGAVGTSEIADGTVADADIAFNYAGSSSKGGAATSAVNSDTLDGYHASQLGFYQSYRDFPNGTLIQTDIDYSVTSGEPWLLEIEGNSYGNIRPMTAKYQGYIYSDTVINHGGTAVGYKITGMSLFNLSGKLCFWFPNQGYWQGYNVFVNSSYDGVKRNRLVSVSNVAKPGGITKEVAMTFQQILDATNYNSYSPTLTGVGASGTWGINVTGNAATATTASAVSFNGGLTTASSPSFAGLTVNGNQTVTGNLTVQGSVISDKFVNRTVNNVSISGSILPDAAAPLTYRDIGSSAQRWNNLYLSGQLVSGVATGTAPFTVASTTVNANLNADMVDGLHASSFVQTSAVAGTTNYLSKFTGANAVGNSQVFDTGTGVGIGITSPAYKLHVTGDIYANGGWLRTSGTAGWYSESYGGGWYMQDTSWIRSYSDKSVWVGNGILGTNGSLSAGYGGTAGPAGGAIIAGNVGIGTNAPGVKLHIQGNGNVFKLENTDGVTANQYAQMQLTAGSANNYIWTNNQNSPGFYGGSSSLNLYTGQASPIAFFTNTLERLRIDAVWNVGIGTAAPSTMLTLSGSTGPIISLIGPNANYRGIKVSDGGGAEQWFAGSNASNNYVIRQGGSTDLMTFSGGNVSISGNFTSSAYYYSSDRNLKENIVGLTGSLAKISQLNGYSFDWKSDGRKDLWVIAQEVEKVYPELVATNPSTGFKAVEYGNLVAPLIESVKELKEIADMQNAEIRELKEEVKRLKSIR